MLLSPFPSVFHRDFAAANMIGSTGLKGKSWPDLDMLPLGWLTDPGMLGHILLHSEKIVLYECLSLKEILERENAMMWIWKSSSISYYTYVHLLRRKSLPSLLSLAISGSSVYDH